ncbi:MAG: thioredoxin domain-containing protein [Patescibacteria group bacterium]
MTEENLNQNQEQKKDRLLPLSILVAAVLVSGSLIYNAGKKVGTANLEEAANPQAPSLLNVEPVSGNDHVWGNPEAPVKIIEFSDLECPFCKRFHPTLKKIVEDYKNEVAWVYRHFPLDSLHSKARKEAEATECANELGGNDKFWGYVDRLFEVTPSNNGLDPAELLNIAEYVGLNRIEFESCLSSGRYANRVAEDLKDAVNSGGEGTPYSMVIGKDGKKYPVSGALPYEQVKLVIDQALGK